jgi:hypothetical protein
MANSYLKTCSRCGERKIFTGMYCPACWKLLTSSQTSSSTSHMQRTPDIERDEPAVLYSAIPQKQKATLKPEKQPQKPEKKPEPEQSQEKKSPAAPAGYSLVGLEHEQPVLLKQSSRFAGTYMIGATGTGKSGLLQNLIIQDIKTQKGVCVLDPHGELINAVIASLPTNREKDVILLDIHDYLFPFGLNLFSCADPTNPVAVQVVVDRVMHVFEKLLGVSTETPLILEYLQNCTYTLVANQGYTMAEIPLLLQDGQCRRKLLVQVTDPDVLLFWKRYERMKPTEQDEKAVPILRRVQEFLQPLTRPIVGQSASTMNLQEIMDQGKILLVKLDVLQLEAISHLIGSLLVALFLTASPARRNKNLYAIYVDEFQRFSTPDFATFFAEARKFGIGLTVAHQFRDQLDLENKGATLTAANMIIFRVSNTDADELAGQFDITPQPAWEEELEPEQMKILKPQWHERKEEVIEDGVEEKQAPVRDVVAHLVRVGHPNFVVDEFVKKILKPIYEASNDIIVVSGTTINFGWAGKEYIVKWLNDLFYDVMVSQNPRKIVPIKLFHLLAKVASVSFGFTTIFRFVEQYFVRYDGYSHVRFKPYEYWYDSKKNQLFEPLEKLWTDPQFNNFTPDTLNQNQIYQNEILFRLIQNYVVDQIVKGVVKTQPFTDIEEEFQSVYKEAEAQTDFTPFWTEEHKFGVFLAMMLITMNTLAKEPITTGSGITQPRKRVQVNWITHESEKITIPRKTILHPQRTYADVLNEMANQLVGLPDYTARVRIKDEEEHLIQTVKPTSGVYGKGLQRRIADIQARNRKEGFTRSRQEVENEIRLRQSVQPEKTGQEPQQPLVLPKRERRIPLQPAASDSQLEQELEALYKQLLTKGLTTLGFKEWREHEEQQLLIDWLKKQKKAH